MAVGRRASVGEDGYCLMRARRNHIEDGVQAEIIGLLKVAAIDGLLWFAVPNGGLRDWNTARVLKDTGVRAGVADLFLGHHALGLHFLEVKTPARGSGLSKVQEYFRDECEAKGFRYGVARSRNEAQDILTDWGLLRVRKAVAA